MTTHRQPLQEITSQQNLPRLLFTKRHHQMKNGNHSKSKCIQSKQRHRYRPINGKTLGSGAYGTVYAAIDTLTNRQVAIKVIKPQTDDALLCPTTIREIGLLKQIQHKNIVNLLQIEHQSKTSTIFLVFERAQYDLKKFWNKFYKKHNFCSYYHSQSESVITIWLLKNIMVQIIEAISFLHGIKVIHRDIKPQNILLFEGSDGLTVKLADFGLARGNNSPNLSLTTEVVTLWYRPIELLLGCKVYDKSVDVWAIGCVLYELITNEPLFPAQCQIETIFKIYQLTPNVISVLLLCIYSLTVHRMMGTPSMINWSTLESLRYYQAKMPQFRKTEWATKHIAFCHVDVSVTDLLDKLMKLNPSQRISASNALKHPFLSLHANNK